MLFRIVVNFGEGGQVGDGLDAEGLVACEVRTRGVLESFGEAIPFLVGAIEPPLHDHDAGLVKMVILPTTGRGGVEARYDEILQTGCEIEAAGQRPNSGCIEPSIIGRQFGTIRRKMRLERGPGQQTSSWNGTRLRITPTVLLI